MIAPRGAGASTPSTFGPAVAGSWAGPVHGGNAFVAVVVAKHTTAGRRAVLAYVCDGVLPLRHGGGPPAARATIVEWFHAETSSNHFVVSSKDGYRLDVTVSKGQATGTLTFPGAHGAVDAFLAASTTGMAGLYRAQRAIKGNTYLAGVIVLKGKRARGAVRVNSVISATADWSGPGARPTVTVNGNTLALRDEGPEERLA